MRKQAWGAAGRALVCTPNRNILTGSGALSSAALLLSCLLVRALKRRAETALMLNTYWVPSTVLGPFCLVCLALTTALCGRRSTPIYSRKQTQVPGEQVAVRAGRGPGPSAPEPVLCPGPPRHRSGGWGLLGGWTPLSERERRKQAARRG